MMIMPILLMLFVKNITNGAPLVNRWHKKFVDRIIDGVKVAKPLNQSELSEGFACFDTHDFKMGYQAFLNKQKPKFEGR